MRDGAAILSRKDADLEPVVQAALTDDQLLQDLLAGLASKEDALRYNCFRALTAISEQRPLRLYPAWDHFVELMSSSNAYQRAIGLRLIAGVTCVDTEQRFEPMFDRYFDLLDDEKVMTARYLAQAAARIAVAKPHLRERIVQKLLAVDETHHAPGRKDLIKADIIESLAGIFPDSPDQEEILTFVERQRGAGSPKTREAAKAFLLRYGKQNK
jgi:hypothetical protein